MASDEPFKPGIETFDALCSLIGTGGPTGRGASLRVRFEEGVVSRFTCAEAPIIGVVEVPVASGEEVVSRVSWAETPVVSGGSHRGGIRCSRS